MKSAVASGGPFDVGDSARLLGTFPENLGSELGGGELTFEMSARSNLKPMVVAMTITALNDFSSNLNDVSIPVFEVSGIEGVVIEIDLV